MNDIVYTMEEALDRLKNPEESTLSWISLSGDEIGDQGAVALALAIRYTTAPIQSIGLRNTKIGDQGAVALALAIRHCVAPIKRIRLSHNKIGDQGAVALALAIRHCVAPIQSIDLTGNGIGDQGAVALASMITHTNAPITWIGLENNKINNRGATAIENALRYNDTISSLLLGGNNVAESIIKAIHKLCKNTPRNAAVIAWRQKYPLIVDSIDDTVSDDDIDEIDDIDVDMSPIYLSVEI